jgi:hypothetical protein
MMRIGLGILLLCIGCARGAIVFDQLQVDVTAQSSDSLAQGVFHFKNTGDQPVDITEVKTSCNCTTAQLARTHYAPGESGDLHAAMSVVGVMGDDVKRITVQTNDGAPPQKLTFHVHVVTLAVVAPQALFWAKGYETGSAEVRIRFPEPNEPAQSVKVIANADRLQTTLQTIEPGRKYELEVVPKSVASGWRESVVVEVQFPNIGVRRYTCYACVK